MTKQLYEKLIDDAEREIAVAGLRIQFWQRKIAEGKGSKTETMQQLMNQTAVQKIQEEWLAFVREKSKGVIEKVVDAISPKKK